MQLTTPSLVNALAWLCALVAIGAWTTAGFLRPRRGERRLTLAGDPLVRIGQVSSGVGSVLAGVMIAVGGDLAPRGAWELALVCGLLSLAVGFLRRWETALYVIVLQSIALIAPIPSVAALSAPNHDISTDAAVLSTISFTALAGGWLMSRLLPRAEHSSDTVRTRLRWLSLATTPLVVLGSLAILWAHHGPDGWFGASARWQLVQLVCALAIAALSLTGAAATPLGLVAAAVGIAGMLATIGAHRSLPLDAAAAVAPDIRAFGYSVADWPTLYNLVMNGRLNLLFATLAAVAVTSYLILLRRLHARGEHWPVGRTIAWLLGWAVVVFVTSAGVGRYAAAVFSVHMFLNLALNMLCAMLLCLGGIVTLIQRATPSHGPDETAGAHEWITATMHSRLISLLYNPIIALAFMTGSYYVFYLSGLFTASLQTHWLAQYFYLHFLITGYIFYGSVIGVDQPPHPLPHIGRLGMIIGAMPFHAFFGVTLMAKGIVFGGDFLTSLGYHWQTARGLLHDQWVGGVIAWAGGEFPLTLALAALLTQWKREDKAESRAIDTHLDAGDDESYDAYNDMLAQLAQRDRATNS